MAIDGEYAASPRGWVRDQVQEYEASGGTLANTLRDTGLPIIVVTTVGHQSGKVRKVPLMRVEHDGEYALVASQGGAAAYYRDYRKRKKRKEDSDIAGASDRGAAPEVAKCASRMDKSAVLPPKATGQPSAKADANRDTKSGQAPVMTGKYLLVPWSPGPDRWRK